MKVILEYFIGSYQYQQVFDTIEAAQAAAPTTVDCSIVVFREEQTNLDEWFVRKNGESEWL